MPTICCSPPLRRIVFTRARCRSWGKRSYTYSIVSFSEARARFANAPSRRFTSAVSGGNNRRPRGQHATPRSGRWWAGRFVMSAPWNVTAPRVGGRSLVITLRIVDLPEPFEPMITVMAPCFASSPTPESTWVPAYPASIPSSRSTGRLRAEVRLDDRGVADDLLRRPLRNLPPFLDHHDAVGEREDGPHDVFDDQGTNPEFLLDPREQLDRLAEFPGGQSREHLVQEENSRARRDDAREFQPLPVLHGEVRCEGSGFCLQAYESKNAGRLLGGLPQVCPPQGAEQGRDGHVLATCHSEEWPGDLMGLGDPPPDDAVRWFPVNSTAIEGDRPRGRLLHAGDHVQEGRLPRAVRSDEPDDLALGEGERHAPEGPHAPEILVNSLGDECHRHSRIP